MVVVLVLVLIACDLVVAGRVSHVRAWIEGYITRDSNTTEV